MVMEIFFSKAQRQRHHRRLRIKIYFITGLISLIFILGGWLVFHLPLLKINKFELVNLQSIEETRGIILQNGFAQLLGFDNFLAWPSQIGDIEIKKDYFGGTLTLTKAEKIRFDIWCANK